MGISSQYVRSRAQTGPLNHNIRASRGPALATPMYMGGWHTPRQGSLSYHPVARSPVRLSDSPGGPIPTVWEAGLADRQTTCGKHVVPQTMLWAGSESGSLILPHSDSLPR
ncbi:hypothetical protein M3J09_004836 [Ascochyta lentis]